MIYSAHDDQMTNMLTFLGVDFYWVPFAATVTYELKYSANCNEGYETASEKCFSVAILHNGKPLQFPECSGDHFTLNGCSYQEFIDLMESKWYSGPSSDDLDKACFMPYGEKQFIE